MGKPVKKIIKTDALALCFTISSRENSDIQGWVGNYSFEKLLSENRQFQERNYHMKSADFVFELHG